ncbi:ABC transporter substrate-binding protein [Citricoccus sp. I39-566]|uniref:ABC transporter substrate-binding protein n=1 Tax=Citricoccus sp. I39-566 TaxID=3073268 RepID=UPI00286CD0AE|nr:ABC transporter substrate-binding protein [Citricoccus sp. I39-566]WMY79763.1 ABC transporter substrate-binding protein [Citricoccus sp. I39-566]
MGLSLRSERHSSIPWTAAAAALLALSLTACGGGSPSGDAPSSTSTADEAGTSGEVQKVTVGVMPLVDLAPLYLGVDQGIFEKHGLELELQAAQGGAAIIPAVTSGQADFGFSNPTSLLIAASKGLDIKVIAPGGSSTGDEASDYGATVVLPESDVESAADLEGHTVAVNTLNNISDSTVKEAVRQAGGDSSAVEFVEMPFPNMVAAVEQGTVDSAFLVEPFLTMGLAEEMEPVFWNWMEVSPDLMASAYFTTGAMAEDDPELVAAFQEAMAESADYAEAHPDETRSILDTYTSIPPEVAAELRLPRWVDEVNTDSLERLIQISSEDGLLDGNLSVEDVVLPGAP